jgi:hypothetical protein
MNTVDVCLTKNITTRSHRIDYQLIQLMVLLKLVEEKIVAKPD